MWRTLICLWCVHVSSVRSQYTYRLLGGPAPPPAPPPAHFVSRTSRHYDTRAELSPGPYLQKDNFFSSGFLEDLLGLGKPESYPPPKREIQHQSIFPSFFSAPSPPPAPPAPQRPYRPPPPPQYPVSYPKPKPSNTPRPKKFSHKADSPYKYTVKGASTHYVENPSSGAAVQGYPASRPPPHHMHRNPSPLVHSPHFNIESPFPQSAKSSHEFASPSKNGNRSPERVSHQGHSGQSPGHKVKPFVHSQPYVDHPGPGAPPASSPFFSPAAPASAPLSLHPMSPMSPVVSHQPPSMAEVIRHIDTETARHKHLTSTSTPLTSANTIKSSPFTSFQDFDVTSNIATSNIPTSTEQQDVPRKDVFQLFQKVPEQFSLVTEVDQEFQVPDIENSIESSPDAKSFIKEENNYHSSNEILDSSTELQNDITVSRVSPKIRQSFDSATILSTAHTSSTAKSLIESSTVKRRGTVSDRGRGSQNIDTDNNVRITERSKDSSPKPKPKKRFLLKSRSKQSKEKTVTPKKTSFSSFPYRDNIVHTSARQLGDAKKIKRKVQRHQKLVSLEDKQEKQKETLQRLLDIAGAGWSTEGGGSGGSRNSIVRGQQHQEPPRDRGRGGEFECPEPEGHFSAPGDCRTYFRCVHGAWSRIQCGEGLVWNAGSGQCDWEEEVGCDQ